MAAGILFIHGKVLGITCRHLFPRHLSKIERQSALSEDHGSYQGVHKLHLFLKIRELFPYPLGIRIITPAPFL